MKKISNFSNPDLRRDQFEVLIDLIFETRDRAKLKKLIQTFLSQSEAAYIAQRIDIMRMLVKGFDYTEIKDCINVSNTAITNAKKFLDAGGAEFSQILLSYRFKERAMPHANKKNIRSFNSQSIKMPRQPGSIF